MNGFKINPLLRPPGSPRITDSLLGPSSPRSDSSSRARPPAPAAAAPPSSLLRNGPITERVAECLRDPRECAEEAKRGFLGLPRCVVSFEC